VRIVGLAESLGPVGIRIAPICLELCREAARIASGKRRSRGTAKGFDLLVLLYVLRTGVRIATRLLVPGILGITLEVAARAGAILTSGCG